jgi:hypothetical protein
VGGGTGGGNMTIVLHETFNDASKFVLNDSGGTATTFHSDGEDEYFGISDGLGGGLWNGDTPPNDSKAYIGFFGNFLTGEFLDQGGPASVRIEWNAIDVTGLNNLEFSVQLAEFDDLGGSIDQDDFIRVEVRFDGGSYIKLIEFFANTANDLFREDVGLNGTADGDPLDRNASSWIRPIVGTGTTLDVRLSVKLDADQEDFGVDNVMITAP